MQTLTRLGKKNEKNNKKLNKKCNVHVTLSMQKNYNFMSNHMLGKDHTCQSQCQIPKYSQNLKMNLPSEK